MIKRLGAIVLFLFGVLLLQSCDFGGDSKEPVTGMEGFEAAKKGYLEMFCTYYTSCLPRSYADDAFLEPGDVKTCMGVFAAMLDFSSSAEAFETGHAYYDPSKLSDCLAAIKRMSCDEVREGLPPQCRKVIYGTLSEGESCKRSVECAPGLYCDSLGSCPGTCKTQKAEGEPCEGDDYCQDNLICNDGMCEGWDSLDLAEEGEECGSVRCVYGTSCVPDGSGSGICTPWGKEGEECDAERNLYCHPDLRCDPDNHKCVKPKIVGEEGASCDETTVCDLSRRLVCDDGRCVRIPSRGEECGVTSPYCWEGLRCDPSTGRCTDRRNLGETCERDRECVTDYCDENNTCAIKDVCEE